MQIDFILAWNSRIEVATTDSARSRRATFESNLEKEDLVLERLPEEPSGLNFIKVHAPDSVLKRYAEILKLRLPMKKVCLSTSQFWGINYRTFLS